MQTEDLQLQPRRHDPHALSRALQPLAPLCCELVTSWGRPVTLSSAGYVLRYGHSYRLRVSLPLAEGEVKELKLINVPQFITQDKALLEVDEDGQVWAIPFKVHADFWSGLTRLGLDVRCDELELAAYMAPSSPRENIQYACPIVVSHRWLFILLLVTLGMLGTLAHQAITSYLGPNPPSSWSAADVVEALTLQPASWWGLIGITVTGIVVNSIVRLATIGWRCRSLRTRFHEAYPIVEELT